MGTSSRRSSRQPASSSWLAFSGRDNYGVFTLSLAIPGLILLFLGFGVNTAVTRYAAYYLSLGKSEEARRFSRNAILFLALFGLALTAMNYAAAGVLSSVLYHRPEITGYVQAASVFILGQAVFQAAHAGLIGWNSMKLASASPRPGVTVPISSLVTYVGLILLLQFVVFVSVYLTVAPIVRAVSLEDIARLEVATEGLGVVGKLIEVILEYEKLLAGIST